MALTRRFLETFDQERVLAEVWRSLRNKGASPVSNTRTFEVLTYKQQLAELWYAIEQFDVSSNTERKISGITTYEDVRAIPTVGIFNQDDWITFEHPDDGKRTYSFKESNDAEIMNTFIHADDNAGWGWKLIL